MIVYKVYRFKHFVDELESSTHAPKDNENSGINRHYLNFSTKFFVDFKKISNHFGKCLLLSFETS